VGGRRRDGNKQRKKIKAAQRYPFNKGERQTMKFEDCMTRQLGTITRQPASRMQTGRARSLAFGGVKPTKQELLLPPL